MSSVQERLQLKRVPLDVWNIREQLCLASAVVRSGDQNWMSVSRALKTVGEPNRPSDWYSQKSCAAQYGALLEHVETPKRKKRCSEGAVETPQESILKKLTQERVVEIQKTVAEMSQQYEQLKSEVAEARNPSTSEDRLREMWASIEAAKRARERDSARRAALLKEREERRARVDRTWRPPSHTPPTTPVSSAAPSSPLLTSLLKSSPVVTTPQHISHPANSVDCVSPSAGAPTLSMLLEKAGGTPHEKAAIEHIKSQLVQIEHQLRANSTPPPATTAPPVDIDDIEIKAEDVYAFRDLDLSIPLLHKRPTDKPTPKKDDEQPTASTAMPAGEQVKEEPMAVDAPAQEIESVEVVAEEPPPPIVHEEEPPKETTENEPKIAFPEFKFPTTEIKIIQSDEEKIKEEVKDVEEPEPPKVDEEDEEVNVEDTSVTADEPISEPPPPEPPAPPEPEVPVPEEAPSIVPVHIPPEDIPLPPSPEPEAQVVTAAVCEEPPLPPEPEPEPEPAQEQPEMKDTTQKETEDKTEKEQEEQNEEVVKEDDGEDSMPLKDIKQEAEPSQEELEVKEELLELEDTHTETDDDTPMELSREEEKDGRKRRDYSRKKKSDSRTCSGSESAAEASAPDSPSGSDAEREYRLWKRSVMLVYSRLCAHKYASLFLRPITDEEAPNYSVVVKRPMDLTTIRKNIDGGVIRTTSEFQRDVLLMLSNALMYNSSEHSVYRMAKEMHEEAGCQLGMLVAAQAHAGLCAPPPARKRRRHHNTSA